MRTADLAIVLLNFNHAQVLPRSIEALLSQSVRAREILIADDASTDDSWAVIESYARRDPSIRPVRNERNLGVVASFNEAYPKTSATYVGAAAADDYVLPGYIEKSMALLERYPRAGISCAYLSSIDERRGKIYPGTTTWCTQPSFFTPAQLAKFIGITCIGSSTSIYRRSSLVQSGGYLPDLKWYSDWFMNLVIAFRDGICHIPEMLALITLQDVSYSTGRKENRDDHAAVLGNVLNRLLSTHADVAPFFRECGALAAHGTDLIRAAARRPDCREWTVLSLINGFARPEYEELLDDDDPKTRELAELLMGPRWRVRNECEQSAALESERDQARAEFGHAMSELQRSRNEVHWLRTSKFWACRDLLMRGKRALHRLLGRHARPDPF